jgi:hypothetical protein
LQQVGNLPPHPLVWARVSTHDPAGWFEAVVAEPFGGTFLPVFQPLASSRQPLRPAMIFLIVKQAVKIRAGPVQ